MGGTEERENGRIKRTGEMEWEHRDEQKRRLAFLTAAYRMGVINHKSPCKTFLRGQLCIDWKPSMEQS